MAAVIIDIGGWRINAHLRLRGYDPDFETFKDRMHEWGYRFDKDHWLVPKAEAKHRALVLEAMGYDVVVQGESEVSA